MDRNILNQLYNANKVDTINREQLINTIEKLQEMLQDSNSNKTSDYVYTLLCDYFKIDEDDIELLDIISEATSTSNYKTLKDLETKIYKVKKK